MSLEGSSLAGVSSLHILGTQLTCTSWTVQTHAEIKDFQCTWYMISRDLRVLKLHSSKLLILSKTLVIHKDDKILPLYMR